MACPWIKLHTHTRLNFPISMQPSHVPSAPALLHPAAIESAPVGFTLCACHPGRMAPCRWSSCGVWLQRSSLSWSSMMDLASGQSLIPRHRPELPWRPLTLTGGAQQALNAAINLHHGGFESERGVCDRRYVSGNEV